MLREPKEMPPNAVGMLYDSTLCIGCRACVAACREANGTTPEQPEKFADWNAGTWDTAEDLSGDTFNVIRVYLDGTKEHKDRDVDGYAFMKRHCLHCVDPSCVSVCPVSAMRKDPDTGIVTHDRRLYRLPLLCLWLSLRRTPVPARQSFRRDRQVRILRAPAGEGRDPRLLRRLPNRRLAVRQGRRPPDGGGPAPGGQARRQLRVSPRPAGRRPPQP